MKLPPKSLRSVAAALLLLSAAACQDQPAQPGQPVEPVQPTQEPQVSVPPRAPNVAAQQSTPDAGNPGNSEAVETDANALSRKRVDESVVTAYALAELQPVGDSETSGTVSFMTGVPEGTGIRVIAEFTSLPAGPHGIHIHENGDCSAPDASSAGGHFNPTNHPHADRSSVQRHIGDLGNLVADANNLASVDFHDDKMSFEGPNSILGKAVVVHSTEDDLMTQPDGAAGERIACGVIESRESRDLDPSRRE